MSEFKRMVVDGRTINIPKGSKLLDTYLKKQGAKNSDDVMRDRIFDLQRKYPGNHGFIV